VTGALSLCAPRRAIDKQRLELLVETAKFPGKD
jgi:hypothetical protein